MDATQPRDDRPRFGLMDVFVLIAAFSATLVLLKVGYELVLETTHRMQSTTSAAFTPRTDPPPRVAWNASEFAFLMALTAPLAAFVAQPFVLGSHYLQRRRKSPLTRMEVMAVTPLFCCIFLGLLVPTVSHLIRPPLAGVINVAVTGLVFPAGWAISFCFGDPSPRSILWTDRIGAAALIVEVLFLGWLLIVIAAAQ